MDLTDYLFSNILTDSYIKRDMSLGNLKKNLFTFTKPFNDFNFSNDLIIHQLELIIHKQIFNTLNETGNIDYIDHIDKDVYDSTLIGKINTLILSNNYKFLITNGQIGFVIRNSPIFISNVNMNSACIGSISNTVIYVNNNIDFGDNRIFMFNDFYINIKNVNKIEDEYTISVRFDMNNRVTDLKSIFILNSKQSKNYSKCKYLIRENFINKLLDS